MYAVKEWRIIEQQNERKSAIITAIITFILFLILFFWVLGWPKEDEMPLAGVLIDFGTSKSGFGDNSTPPKQEVTPPVEEVNIEDVQEPQESATQPQETQPSITDEVVTQDQVEAPSVTPEVVEDPRPTQEELDAIAQAQAEADAQAAAEAAAAVQAAAEAQAQAEADELAEQLDVWGNGGDGNTEPGGDQGVEDGVEDGPYNDGESSTGLGDQGTGPALWGLGNRGWVTKPKVQDDSQRFGKVTLKIKVDRNGNIISAEFTNYKSTTTDAVLIRKAKEALKHAKITKDINAADEDWGYVTFNFKPG